MAKLKKGRGRPGTAAAKKEPQVAAVQAPAQPLVSIIIPALNADPGPAILNVLGQSFASTQIIVVHSGAGPAAHSAMTYAARHPGWVVGVQSQRTGLYAALNCALEQATGQFVTFMKGHWALANGCLQEFANLLRERQDTDLCKYLFSQRDPLMFPLTLGQIDALMMRRPGTRLLFLDQWRCAFYARSLLTERGLSFREDLVWGGEQLFHAQAVLACRSQAICGGCVCYPSAPMQDGDPQRLNAMQVRSLVQSMMQVGNMLSGSGAAGNDQETLLSWLQICEQLEITARRAPGPEDARRCRSCISELLQTCPCREAVAARLPGFSSIAPDGGGNARPPGSSVQVPRFPAAPLEHPLFRHSGSLGDVIYSLPALAALTARFGRGGAVLCLRAGGPGYLSEGGVRALRPLLQAQPYIHEVRLWQGERPDFDLDSFRAFPVTGRGDIMHWYQYALPIAYDTSQPWLSGVEPAEDAKGALVISRALRRQATGIDYAFLRRYDRVLFIGLEHEYAEMRASIPHIQWYRTSDFMEVARVIAAARLCICSQSSPCAVAEGLKVPRLMEMPLSEPVAIPSGPRGALFCLQGCFEQLVADFWGDG